MTFAGLFNTMSCRVLASLSQHPEPSIEGPSILLELTEEPWPLCAKSPGLKLSQFHPNEPSLLPGPNFTPLEEQQAFDSHLTAVLIHFQGKVK